MHNEKSRARNFYEGTLIMELGLEFSGAAMLVYMMIGSYRKDILCVTLVRPSKIENPYPGPIESSRTTRSIKPVNS